MPPISSSNYSHTPLTYSCGNTDYDSESGTAKNIQDLDCIKRSSSNSCFGNFIISASAIMGNHICTIGTWFYSVLCTDYALGRSPKMRQMIQHHDKVVGARTQARRFIQCGLSMVSIYAGILLSSQ